MDSSAKIALDATDRKILAELQADARLPNIVLAERVGLSTWPCSQRVTMLEQAGVIEGSRAMIDRTAVGLAVTAFVGIRVERHSRDNAEAFVAAVREMPEVIACHLVSGDSDFLLEVVVPDIATYESNVLCGLRELPAVRDIRTSFAMRTYKVNGPLPLTESAG